MSWLSIVFSHSKDFEDNNVRCKMRITIKPLNKINSNLCTCQIFWTIRLFCKFSSNLDFLWYFVQYLNFFSILIRQFTWCNYCLICGSSKAALLSGCGKCEMRLNDNMIVSLVSSSPLLYEIRTCKKHHCLVNIRINKH
jgi:hypothetical protein